MFKALHKGLKHGGCLKIWIVICVVLLNTKIYFLISLVVMGIGVDFERKGSLNMNYILNSKSKIYFYQLLELDGYCHRVCSIFHIFSL